MNIYVTTMFSPSHEDMAAICVPILKQYCSRHGYQFHEIKIENDKYAYEKHYDFHHLFEQGADLIFYCDVDTVLTNHKIRLESFIDEEHDLYLTKDATELNGGSLIIKGTETGRLLNLLILSYKDKLENEQNALCHIYENRLLINGKQPIKVLPHPSINSYSYDLYPECKEYIGRPDLGDWEPGNFLIHFPALGLKDKVAMMQEFKEKIIYE